ncbi:hypothetical protein ACH3Y9_05400 [Streptomyces sp. WSLK1-5]|uniref:hypothetical protein n=1 Tax=Streptomyces sp. WSLK1-4 TaxID=3375474 RepID=UPI0037B1FA6A
MSAVPSGGRAASQATDRHGRAINSIVAILLATWSDAHDVVLADPERVCEILWGTRYGIESLKNLGSVSSDRVHRLAEQALRAILLGWQTEALTNGRPASSQVLQPL